MKRNQLDNLVSEIAKITGQATSNEEAVKMGRESYLYLEFSSAYGGYRLVNVRIGNGAHFGAFGGNGCEERLSAKTMDVKLRGILAGLEYNLQLA